MAMAATTLPTKGLQELLAMDLVLNLWVVILLYQDCWKH
jgi:hypothetical protein